MKAKRIKIYDNRSKQIVISNLEDIPADGTMYVEIGIVESSRSLAQNKLMWKWFGEFGSYAGYTLQQAHDVFCREILGFDIVIDLQGKEREIIKGTRGLTVKEMADFLTQVEALCSEYGLALPITEDYTNAMK